MYCRLNKLLGKTDATLGFLCALIGAFGVLIEVKSRQKEIALFLIPKFIEILWKALQARGLVGTVPNAHEMCFVLAIGVIGVASSQTGRSDKVRPAMSSLLSYFWD